MTASDYKPRSRRFLCPDCGTEQWFRNTALLPTLWHCQGNGCSVSCEHDAWKDKEPVFYGQKDPEDDWCDDLEFVEEEPDDLYDDPEEAALEPYDPAPPALIKLAPAFDLTIPLSDRAETVMGLLSLVADMMVEREAKENPEAYADPDFRRQETMRQTLKGIEDLRQISNTLELRWAMENGSETWIDADGAETSLLEVIESQMPDEEQRASSGRARQVWSFLDAAQAFKDEGIPERVVAECNKSGLSSVLGIVARTQRKLAEVTPGEDLRDKYEQLIEAAAETTNLKGLKARIRTIIDPTDVPPAPIRYSVEADGEDHCWFVAYPTRDQFVELVLKSLGDVLEVDKLLPAGFAQYWQSFVDVPAGQD